jgi:hypothetical protein
MTPTVGIFVDRVSAERAVGNLRAVGLSTKSIHVLVPGTSEPLVSQVPTSEAEQPGIGKAMGGVIGGAVGAVSGAELGAAAAASALLPVAGPAIAIGIVGAVLLSLGGAVVGGALENALANGLPKDELFVYEDALRRGYAIVVVMPADPGEHERTVAVLEGSGAESVDAARERWWIGLRDTEAFEYRAGGLDFPRDEAVYREGFEAALSFSMRDPAERDIDTLLKARYPATYRESAFRRGYDRGRAYYRRLLANRRPSRRDDA